MRVDLTISSMETSRISRSRRSRSPKFPVAMKLIPRNFAAGVPASRADPLPAYPGYRFVDGPSRHYRRAMQRSQTTPGRGRNEWRKRRALLALFMRRRILARFRRASLAPLLRRRGGSSVLLFSGGHGDGFSRARPYTYI